MAELQPDGSMVISVAELLSMAEPIDPMDMARAHALGDQADAWKREHGVLCHVGVTRSRLVAWINGYHAPYKHLVGTHDHWVLVRVRNDIRTKAGQCFLAGDVCLAAPSQEIDHLGLEYRSVFSTRTGINTLLKRDDVVDLADPEAVAHGR